MNDNCQMLRSDYDSEAAIPRCPLTPWNRATVRCTMVRFQPSRSLTDAGTPAVLLLGRLLYCYSKHCFFVNGSMDKRLVTDCR